MDLFVSIHGDKWKMELRDFSDVSVKRTLARDHVAYRDSDCVTQHDFLRRHGQLNGAKNSVYQNIIVP